MSAFREAVAAMDARLVEDLGEPTTYIAAAGAVATPSGIFGAAYVRVDAGLAGVSSSGPAVFYRLSALPADPETDDPRITVNGATYSVDEVKKDGQGGVLLMLRKVG